MPRDSLMLSSNRFFPPLAFQDIVLQALLRLKEGI